MAKRRRVTETPYVPNMCTFSLKPFIDDYVYELVGVRRARARGRRSSWRARSSVSVRFSANILTFRGFCALLGGLAHCGDDSRTQEQFCIPKETTMEVETVAVATELVETGAREGRARESQGQRSDQKGPGGSDHMVRLTNLLRSFDDFLKRSQAYTLEPVGPV